MKLYGIESYIAVPLMRQDGAFFGTLCALDPLPAALPDAKLEVLHQFAQLISSQLEAEDRQQHTEAALLNARETAELRERFLGILGHDLRNPLNAIVMNAYVLLERGTLTGKELLGVQRIRQSADRITGMVAALLDFTRVRLGGGMPISPERNGNLQILLENVIDELAVVHPGSELELKIDGDPEIGWDSGRMAQVISNLTANALQHGDPASPVRLSAEAAADAVVVRIGNRGKPIPVELLERIFEPFERASEQQTGSTSGLGLGLYIARQVVEAHGGTIGVRSDPENGTVFELRLPRHVQADPDLAN